MAAEDVVTLALFGLAALGLAALVIGRTTARRPARGGDGAPVYMASDSGGRDRRDEGDHDGADAGSSNDGGGSSGGGD